MIRLLNGDCLEVLAGMAPESIDACVTDPPYHLLSTVERFAKTGGADRKIPVKEHQYARLSRGFMGKSWDGGDIAFRPETWAAVLRVLKPGAHLVAFGAPKNYHRLACAIEDAGFEIRDSLMWLFGSGFPKSHDVSKGIDKAAGAVREKVRDYNPRNPKATGGGRDGAEGATRPWIEAALERGYHEKDGNEPATLAAREWQGWGTALKPAFEPIILARKPLIGTVAANVLAHGTGAINVDGCRVGTEENTARQSGVNSGVYGADNRANVRGGSPLGRWPANIVHDGSDEVLAGFPDSKGQLARVGPEHGPKGSVNTYGDYGPRDAFEPRGDSGSAARFFYCAKAGKADRAGSKHPTVKPIALMRWLCRLITPPGGTILDPFAGTGTTGQAAQEEGFGAVLIEREAEYQADIRRRLGLPEPLPAEIEEALA